MIPQSQFKKITSYKTGMGGQKRGKLQEQTTRELPLYDKDSA